jgi:hypothetical protein
LELWLDIWYDLHARFYVKAAFLIYDLWPFLGFKSPPKRGDAQPSPDRRGIAGRPHFIAQTCSHFGIMIFAHLLPQDIYSYSGCRQGQPIQTIPQTHFINETPLHRQHF